jgi:hypothetical protein
METDVTGTAVPEQEFFDSIRPLLIPDGAWAALYFDGDWPASPREALRFARVRWITIEGDWENCGIADYEPGNPVYLTPGLLKAWATARIQGMRRRARVYTNRYDLPRAQHELGELAGQVEWWIATLDGDKLTRDWIPGLWAVQYQGGPRASRDKSVLYGAW